MTTMALARKRDAVELDVDSVLCMGAVRKRSPLFGVNPNSVFTKLFVVLLS
jgi:hypothetical protein